MYLFANQFQGTLLDGMLNNKLEACVVLEVIQK